MRKVLAVSSIMACASMAWAGVSDDFESYADTTAMMAVWGDDGGGNGTLVGAGGNPGQYATHPAGNPGMRRVVAPLNPAAGQPIIWEFDFLDHGLSSNRRYSGGLRDNGGGAGLNSILEMGMHNNQPWPEDPCSPGAATAGYAIRTVFNAGSPGNWVALDTNPAPVAGWHHWKATILPTSILFELDLFADGSVDGSRLVTTSDTSFVAYNVLRLGGPSDVSDPGNGLGPVGFDNVSISQVPEPASLALLAMMGALALRRRRG